MIWEAEADASAIRLDCHRKLESILKQSHQLPHAWRSLLNMNSFTSTRLTVLQPGEQHLWDGG